MPKKFNFYINNEKHFSCKLQSVRCTSISNGGNRCKNKTVIGTSFCWRHLMRDKQVRIKQSEYGLGLFALNPNKGERERIFKEGDTIVKYDGEIISQDERRERYNDQTAPYGVQMRDNTVNDGACRRGVGTLVNHSTGPRENARFSFTRNGELQIKAIKNIYNNREIFINYNKGRMPGEPRYNFINNHETK